MTRLPIGRAIWPSFDTIPFTNTHLARRRLHRSLPPHHIAQCVGRVALDVRAQARRLQVHRPARGDRVRVFSLNAKDWTEKVPGPKGD